MSQPIAPGIHGKQRLSVLRLHRLAEFQRVFDLYLDGKTSSEHVTRRAKLMLAVGLPKLH